MKNLLLVLLFVSFFSCTMVRVVDLDDHNKKIQETLGLAEKGAKRAEIDVIDHELILTKWSDDKSKQGLVHMRSLQQNLVQNYLRLKEDFENSPFRHKTKISSKDADYDAFSSYSKDFEKRFEILDKQFDNYRSASLKLNAYLETKSIYRVNPPNMKADFIKSINQAKQSQIKVKNELMDLNLHLNSASLDPKAKQEKKVVIQELVKTVEKIENETFKLQRLFNSTMKEINSGVKFVTRGMKAHNYLDKIQSHIKVIETQVNEFNLKSKNFAK